MGPLKREIREKGENNGKAYWKADLGGCINHGITEWVTTANGPDPTNHYDRIFKGICFIISDIGNLTGVYT